MVPTGLLRPSFGGSVYADLGLENIQGIPAEFQKPDYLVFYDGSTTDVPTLVCPGHLKLLPAVGFVNPFEVPYDRIRRATTIAGNNTQTKKSVTLTCNIVDCESKETFGVYIYQTPDPRIPIPYEQKYFDYEQGVPEGCDTDCTTRAQIIADKINADVNAIVVATVSTTTLTLVAKDFNLDFRVDAEGFTKVVNAQPGSVNYTYGKLREAYGPNFAPGKADTTLVTATEIHFDQLLIADGFGGTSSVSSFSERYWIQQRILVVVTDATTNSAAAKTELDAILNYGKTPALYHDKLC